jgi:NADH:ubiquinone oxidoreductase subunit F (NADH-binding)
MTTATRTESRLLADTNSEPPPNLTAPQLIAVLRESGLTGRGGAGFPVWRKVAAVHAARRRPVVIANGAEGEPASGKDKVLLAYRPQLVRDGLQVVARALGASETHLYVGKATDTFVSGEESAVVAALAGKPAVPADKRVRLTESGLGGAPTLVQNVETLAHIAQIARYGPAWFRAGETFLATVGGAVAAPGVVEAGVDVRLGDLLDAAGGPTAQLQAVLIGGYHGAWIPADPDLRITPAGLAPFGATRGAGIVLALAADVCGLAETARYAAYLAGQVAGQCGPCINGLPRLADTLTDLAGRNPRPGLPAEVERLAGLVTGRGACTHPDGTARLIRSALRFFAADVAAHLSGRCLAGAA